MRKSVVFTFTLMLSLLLAASYGFADGFRRNIASASKEERDRFRDAIIALNTDRCRYPGTRDQEPTGGVTCWFKQDEIHAGSHVHDGPAFLPWHRELLNRFEVLLRQMDPSVSLYYWDWTTDPTWMFTSDFMGGAHGEAGDPWLAAGFYNPNASPCRSVNEFDPNNNPADPPCSLTRNVRANRLVTPAEEEDLLAAQTFEEFDSQIRPLHLRAHTQTIGGTLFDPHTAFRDPFVFLLHSNIDRLFAMWQQQVGHLERLNPDFVYGSLSNTKGEGDVASGNAYWGILSPLEPWAGPEAQNASTGIINNVEAVRPWAPPENQQEVKNSRHPSVVAPPIFTGPGGPTSFTSLWAGMLTKNTNNAGTDSSIMLTIRQNGETKFDHVFANTPQDDQETGQANLYEVNVIANGIAGDQLANTELQAGISGDDEWDPEHFVVWGQRFDGAVIPLAMETDLTVRLSTNPREGQPSFPLRHVGQGGDEMPIKRLLLLMTTADVADAGTDSRIKLQISSGARLVVDFEIPDTPQRDLERAQANLYFVPVLGSSTFTKNSLDDTSIGLSILGTDAWLPASLFLFGIDSDIGRPANLVPLVHIPTWNLGQLSTDPSEGNAFVNLPLQPRLGDIDGDGDVDRDDLEILLRDRGKSVSQSACGALCDLNGDGHITGLDVRELIRLCSRPNCATE